jgi:DNA gyrase subunit B
MAGVPPFTVKLGDQDEEALSFEDLPRAVLKVASKGMNLQRFKGLGEMDAIQLWNTTMDPEHRTLLQVTLEDAVEAGRLFSILMGEDVPSRKAFIEANAKYVRNLDV